MSGECDKCQIYKKTLQDISRILENIKYDLCSREYSLDEDEMSWVFYCRDLAQKTLMECKDDM